MFCFSFYVILLVINHIFSTSVMFYKGLCGHSIHPIFPLPFVLFRILYLSSLHLLYTIYFEDCRGNKSSYLKELLFCLLFCSFLQLLLSPYELYFINFTLFSLIIYYTILLFLNFHLYTVQSCYEHYFLRDFRNYQLFHSMFR